MIKIYNVLGVKGYILGYPDWYVKNDGVEIKFPLIPDSTSNVPYLNTEMAMINVMVFKRNITQEDINKWVKGAKISEAGFLCDLEYEENGKIEAIRIILIL